MFCLYFILCLTTLFILVGIVWFSHKGVEHDIKVGELIEREMTYPIRVESIAPLLSMLHGQISGPTRCAFALVGILIALLGMLFMLMRIQARYQLRIGGGQVGSALKTSSPGLVIITLGLGFSLVIICSEPRSVVNVALSAPSRPRDGSSRDTDDSRAPSAPGKSDETTVKPRSHMSPGKKRGIQNGLGAARKKPRQAPPSTVSPPTHLKNISPPQP
ncbi:hypothetical protein JRI60_37060 [Archangium violaceum]|uniref:hypothetical protein n=1 Tax=Archangium violaceum TaxID=83451 RepID=UPI00194ED961|nr:hypothetical protein [Archangium violaceum]QRN94689.1 hypothetical protein JRI60_37060 [Archangium violaceum]